MIKIIKNPDYIDFDRLANLFYDAFSNKFDKMFCSYDSMYRLFRDSINFKNCVIVFDDDKICGIAAVSTQNNPFFNFKPKQFVKEYGLIKGLWRLFLISMLEMEIKNKELYLDSLAVDKEYRGKGIGTKLIDYLEKYCSDNDFGELTLDVIVSNDKAKKLYERLGYSVKYSYRNYWLKCFYGIYGFHRMIKKINK